MVNSRLYIYLLVSTFLLVSCKATPKNNRILFFGDSLTEEGIIGNGYINQLDRIIKQNHQRQYKLICAGVGGDKVYDLYLRLDDVIAKDAGTVVIWIGINDVWQKTLRGTGTDNWKFERFYDAIIKKLKGHNIKVVIVTPTMVGENISTLDSMEMELTEFSEIVKRVAKKNDCPVVEMRKVFIDHLLRINTSNKDSGILTRDGVHLNDKGNALAAESIYKVLKNSVLQQ